ncbi:Hexapeptide repeat of succinyl-transferase [Lutibacter oricola]|uniref:Hexapeptide repeat of succinyl-transferase n=1 Tax=Lutibacter oricola TaxID=762486 RepID=A0A1H2TPS3_9FLAO|nr:acyltransferase [Lutibacter oricola]SDW45772.1 Hexapeptide repeat of succinyl-transferase [Lutibacter oricola]
MKRIYNLLLGVISNLYHIFQLKYFKVSYSSFTINGFMAIRNYGELKLGENLIVNSGKNNNPIGGDVITRFIVKEQGKLIIGDNVGISNSTIFCENSIKIDEGVYIGGSCKIWDTDFHSLDSKLRGTINDLPNTLPVYIKKNAFIGANSIVLKGVVIGENSIVGAGSVVTKSIPSGEVWAGNPAKFIKKINL